MDRDITIKIKNRNNILENNFFIVYIIFILYLSLSKPLLNYSTFKGEDKIVHFISYFLGADLFFLQRFIRNQRRYIL